MNHINFSNLKRIQTYNESTLPIIQYFDNLKMVQRLDASKTPDEVKNNYNYIFLLIKYLN